MSLGIRGSNPIWVMVNLWGKLFDDSYYMWVLNNQIPYQPMDIFEDPDLQVSRDNPVRFFANGTLPNDVYFVSNTTYRLEFRKNNGLAPPSQSDPLIYLVENYVPGEGGTTPVDTVAMSSSNQVTNPQFALVNFVSSNGASPPTFTYSGPASSLPISGKIKVAPGWFLNLGGTGTVTLTQVPLTNSNKNPSNAPYALRITLSGWTANSVFLSQRFEQNGMLWANKYVSTALTAQVNGSPQQVGANLVDSNNSTIGILLPSNTTIDESFNEVTGSALLPVTSNPNTPPAAYIEYQLALPSNIDIYVTSFQLVVQDLPIEPDFEQDSINRQIDHTYNTAYPIVPVGTVIDYYAFGTPQHYLPCNGAAISRTQYQLLFSAVSNLETVTLTSGSAAITVANGGLYSVNAPVEGNGIPWATTISAISGNNITLSANATASGANQLRFFMVGNGDGSTTFNTPALGGLVIAGSGGTLFSSPLSNAPGQTSGNSSAVLVAANIPQHTHSGLFQTSGSGAATPGSSTSFSGTAINTGPGQSLANVPLTTPPTGFSIVQPTALAQKMIRYE